MWPHRLRVFYLHGFASSPGSRKAAFFARRLGEQGTPVHIPDLAAGHFERLTITQQLEILNQLVSGEPAVLIGSSLGGYLAALYASFHPEVDRLILLAPAFDCYHLWVRELGPDRVAAWRERGAMPVFHYGEAREVPLHFEFLEDASRFEPFPAFTQPALIFHGNQDCVVPVGSSIAFAEVHPNTRLIRLDSGHELTDVLDTIWLESQPFLLESKLVLE
jgi:pimeloyl-ACP methyl ester carboxylesterase